MLQVHNSICIIASSDHQHKTSVHAYAWMAHHPVRSWSRSMAIKCLPFFVHAYHSYNKSLKSSKKKQLGCSTTMQLLGTWSSVMEWPQKWTLPLPPYHESPWWLLIMVHMQVPFAVRSEVLKWTVIFSVVDSASLIFFTIVKSTKLSSSDTVYMLELNRIAADSKTFVCIQNSGGNINSHEHWCTIFFIRFCIPGLGPCMHNVSFNSNWCRSLMSPNHRIQTLKFNTNTMQNHTRSRYQ